VPDQRQLIEDLRERIRRIERRPPPCTRVVPAGRPAVDALLGGGFPRGSLVELCGPPGSGKTALAASALARAGDEGALGAWVDGRGELYAPALAPLGVDLARLLIVRPASTGGRARGEGSPRDALWAAEALLASGAFAVVVLDVPLAAGARARGGGASAEAMLRRLGGAAQRGGAAGLWLAEPGAARIPGVVRLDVAPGPGEPVVRRAGAPGAGAGRASHAA
jgi:protein ImuA